MASMLQPFSRYPRQSAQTHTAVSIESIPGSQSIDTLKSKSECSQNHHQSNRRKNRSRSPEACSPSKRHFKLAVLSLKRILQKLSHPRLLVRQYLSERKRQKLRNSLVISKPIVADEDRILSGLGPVLTLGDVGRRPFEVEGPNMERVRECAQRVMDVMAPRPQSTRKADSLLWSNTCSKNDPTA
jgi:hypothetical protein